MNRRTLLPRRTLCSLLALALLAGMHAPPASAQKKRKPKPVVVTFGQPNIWSLEQAHYLLARMHQQSLDLRAKELAEGALDPNATNGTRIDILKQLIDASVSFDQGVGFQNSLATRNAQVNSPRRLELTTDRDRQQSDLLQLAREHARLDHEFTALKADKSATQEDKDAKDAEIKENEADQAAVKDKLAFDDNELKTLGAGSETVQSPALPGAAFDKSKLPETVLDRVGVDKLFDLAKDPKLNASTILDNHIQMQYEIIAKQLTLLRDEVGPGERLVFLELPQSIYTTPGDGDQKMAQSWWHVNGYTRTDPVVRLLLDLLDVERRWKLIRDEVPLFNSDDFRQRKAAAAGNACAVYAATVKAREYMNNAREEWQKEQAKQERKKWESKKPQAQETTAQNDQQQDTQAQQPPAQGGRRPRGGRYKGRTNGRRVKRDHEQGDESRNDATEDATATGQAQQAQATPTPPPALPEEFNAVAIKTAGVDPLQLETFQEFQCDYETARGRLIQRLYREARSDFARAQQGGARDTDEMVEAIRKLISVTSDPNAGDNKNRAQAKTNVRAKGNSAADLKLDQSLSQDAESLRHAEVGNLKRKLLYVLDQYEALAPTDAEKKSFSDKFKQDEMEFLTTLAGNDSQFGQGIEFIRLDSSVGNGLGDRFVDRRTVRTVEIIPRQSSLNVNDLRDTNKAVGIMGAFKFLFGLAGQTSFERQREQFEQFIHQELYASGFGKGDRDFGWTFGALPGTKRVAPGVRTTYAALVVPEDAESIVLTARGCYFRRTEDQPLDFDETADPHWDQTSRNCGDEQTYILPIPGGGDVSSFWVTNVDYQNAAKGTHATVSVRGNNFSSQIGVLVDGVPLSPSVGLAQPLMRVTHKGIDEACPATRVCGEFERIDPQQVVFSFSMPKDADGKDFEGTPTITLVAPGKSIDLNQLPNITVNGERNVKLEDAKRLIFGDRPPEPGSKLGIKDFKVFRVSADPKSREAVALLQGSKFDASKDTIYINGKEVTPKHSTSALYRLEFTLPLDDPLVVTVEQKQDDGKIAVAERTFPNPLALKIGEVSVISYEPPTRKTPGVLLVRIKGIGFDVAPKVSTKDAKSAELLDFSSGEAIVRLVEPAPTAVITLTNPATGQTARAIVAQTVKEDK